MADIILDDVWKVYGDGTEAVRSLDLDVADGEFMVLVGPSGCGKTTALRMVAGLEAISRGTLRIGDREMNDVPPKDRDIAMVFQNYALYPHMSVYENMAFGLKIQRLPKAEIDVRVKEAATILGLEELLGRKPKALSGGQRQRVAMGRAIVRHPQAFLMDEPLSNLDAKLRVQTRAEIARLQSNLGITTLYVTHDQVEAMTMGDRVAVLRKGELQQVDTPEVLYERPANVFVAGFIGSPAMNLVDATVEAGAEGLQVSFADLRLPLRPSLLGARPGLRAREGSRVVLGMRPEDMEDAAFETGAPDGHRITVDVDLRESLGSDVLVHFRVAAPPVTTEDTKELAADVESLQAQAAQGESVFVARLNPRTRAAKGEAIELVVDTERLHFFDPADGTAIHGT